MWTLNEVLQMEDDEVVVWTYIWKFQKGKRYVPTWYYKTWLIYSLVLYVALEQRKIWLLQPRTDLFLLLLRSSERERSDAELGYYD